VFDLINEKDKQHMSSCQTAVTPAVSSSSQPNEQIEKAKAALMMGITSKTAGCLIICFADSPIQVRTSTLNL